MEKGQPGEITREELTLPEGNVINEMAKLMVQIKRNSRGGDYKEKEKLVEKANGDCLDGVIWME